MSINLNTRYPDNTAGPTADYPFGAARNDTAPGDGTGTPLDKDWFNDMQAFLQGLMSRAGVTPSGSADTVLVSDLLNSLSTHSGRVVGSVQELIDIPAAARAGRVFVTGFYTSGDGGGVGAVEWRPSQSKTTHTGGTVYDPDIGVTPGAAGWWTAPASGIGVWVATNVEEMYSAAWFGIKTGADYTAGIQGLIDALIADGKKFAFFPPGAYIVTSLSNHEQVSFIGDGASFNGYGIQIEDLSSHEKKTSGIQPLLQDSNFPLSTSGDAITVTGFPEYKPCFDGDGYLWVPCFGNLTTINPTVSKIDTNNGEVVATIVVNNGPYACVYDPINDRIWVVCSGTVYNDATAYGSSIEVIDPKTGTIVQTIDGLSHFAAGVKLGGGTYEPETQSVWVCDGAGAGTTVYKYNVTTYAQTATVTVDTGPTGITYCPTTGDLYVACYSAPSLVRIDPATAAKVGASLTIGTNPVDVVYDPITQAIMVTDNINGSVGSPSNHGLFKVDPSNMIILDQATSTEFDPFGACYDAESQTLMLMCFTDGRVNRYDTKSMTLIDSFPTNVGGGAQGVISDINNPGVVWSTSNGTSQVWKTYVGRGKHNREWDPAGRLAATAFTEKTQSVAYASPLTIDASLGSIVIVGALTADLTLNVPINGREGQTLRINFTQDATGGWFVFASGSILNMTAGTGYVQAGNTANKTSWVEITLINGTWQKTRPENPYF